MRARNITQEPCFAGFYKAHFGSRYLLGVVMMRFRVTFPGSRASEEVIEATELREASGIVKSRFPDHKRYSIEPDT